jgi:hypothetical protein
MDFDELYRFASRYDSKDSDGDGIDDKTEIYSYVIREKISGKKNVFRPGILKGHGVTQEFFADIDKDGKRAENDDDSDGDGIKDGEEDLNHNGFVDVGETDPYDKDNGENSPKNEIPNNIIIYSLDYIRINDGDSLFKGSSENSQCTDKCDIAAEAKENKSIDVGTGARIGNVYSKGPIQIQSKKTIGTVRYYGNSHVNDSINDIIVFNHDERLWPYHIPQFSAKAIKTKAEKIVRAGESDTLKGVVSFKTIKVEAGGKLYFDEGEISVKNLQLDAGSSIDFVKPDFSMILHVNKNIQWNATTENRNLDFIAKRLKLYYYGHKPFIVNGVWAGTIIAPHAELVLGQTENKKFYGQFLGKGVTVHQYSKIFRVPFNPKK